MNKSKEAQPVSIEQKRLQKRSAQAFNLERESRSTDAGLYDEIVSYLGEYRLHVQKYNYKLHFSGTSIDDSHDGVPMYIKAKRAIAERKEKDLPTHREEAELEALGDPDNLKKDSLAVQLISAETGDAIFWGSPPGPKEEGYGDYGFVFAGRVKKINDLEKDISMTAIRVDHPNLDQYNNAFSEFNDQSIILSHEDQFLKRPFMKRGGVEDAEIDQILRRNFNFDPDEKSQYVFRKVIDTLNPSILDFIQMAKNATTEVKLKAFYAIENYALELKEKFSGKGGEKIIYMSDCRDCHRLKDIIPAYGYVPPQVMGSCGASGEAQSNNILANGYERLMKALFGEFECPDCHYRTKKRVGNECPSCHLTKEEYAQRKEATVCA